MNHHKCYDSPREQSNIYFHESKNLPIAEPTLDPDADSSQIKKWRADKVRDPREATKTN